MTPPRLDRLCVRPDCPAPARASLAYEYGARTVWVDELVAEPSPSSYDLCERHAACLRVPHGWELVDRRSSPRA
ncbi:MAG: DUF3499 domain-containing protein [Acidimicrobiia bacterium]|nr:DUF3499 domain-containing protein [Acidimicrobiia bacterium]